jgi:hypothetical protein
MSRTKCIALQAFFGVCAAFGAGAPGFAQQPLAARVVMVWHAPAGCPTQADVQAEFLRLTDSELLSDDGPALDVNVVVEQSGARWLAHVDMRGALEAERTLEGDSCQALAETGAWLAAQAVRSLGARDNRDAPEDASKAESGSPVAAKPGPVSAPAGSEPRSDLGADLGGLTPSRARSLELGAAVGWDSGALPGPTVALELEFGLWLRGSRFALRPRVFMPRSAMPADSRFSGTSATFILAELPVQACHAWPLGPFEVGPCASAIVGLMWGTSRGLRDARTSVGIWLAVEAALALIWPLSDRVTLRGEVALARPVRVPRFVLGDEIELHRTAGVLVRPGVALGVRF